MKIVAMALLVTATAAAAAPENAIVLTGPRAMLGRAVPEAEACGLRNVRLGPLTKGAMSLALFADPATRTPASMSCLYPRLKMQGWPKATL